LVFGFSRLVRPYGLIIDLTTILIIESRLGAKRRFLFTSFFLSLLHPLSIIPSYFEAFLAQKRAEKLKGVLFTTLPVIIYYLLKFVMGRKVLTPISWIKATSLEFILRLNGALTGVDFPLYQGFPGITGSLILGSLVIYLFLKLFRRNLFSKQGWCLSFFLIYIGITLFTFILTPVLNLKIVRYFVFILPYFLFALLSLIAGRSHFKKVIIVLIPSLLLSYTVFIKPYYNNKASFGSLLQRVKNLSDMSGVPVLFCGYKFHNWFLKKQGYLICSSDKDLESFVSHKEGILVSIHDRFDPFLGDKIRYRSLNLLDSYPDGSIFYLGQ
jgi:hypothetical protein